MEVRQIIEDLRSSLKHQTAEDELLTIITDQLTSLRQSFPCHRSLFTPSDIEFLKSLSVVSHHLRMFIELKAESASVGSLKEYEGIMRQLTCTKTALARLGVAKRVAKEIRELYERLPDIRKQNEANREFRLSARILVLEQNPRRCLYRHPMVIRKGTHGHFWGCSRYPFCSATAHLTSRESDLFT